MLRAAQLSGLAYYSSTTHLAMHACYGPWFALRAVAVFDCQGPDPADPAFDQMTCPYPELEQEAGQEMRRLEGLGGLTNWQAHWKQWAELRGIGGKHTDPRWVLCIVLLGFIACCASVPWFMRIDSANGALLN
jgi:hypothetical protein